MPRVSLKRKLELYLGKSASEVVNYVDDDDDDDDEILGHMNEDDHTHEDDKVLLVDLVNERSICVISKRYLFPRVYREKQNMTW